jgi:hypothetical protein
VLTTLSIGAASSASSPLTILRLSSWRLVEVYSVLSLGVFVISPSDQMAFWRLVSIDSNASEREVSVVIVPPERLVPLESRLAFSA